MNKFRIKNWKSNIKEMDFENFNTSFLALFELLNLETLIKDSKNINSLINNDEKYLKKTANESPDFGSEGVTWYGADTIVAKEHSRNLQEWLSKNPTHKAVVTEYAFELGWLIHTLKEIYINKVDYVTKYFFYADLIEAAKKYHKSNDTDHSPKGLLLYVINESKKYL